MGRYSAFVEGPGRPVPASVENDDIFQRVSSSWVSMGAKLTESHTAIRGTTNRLQCPLISCYCVVTLDSICLVFARELFT